MASRKECFACVEIYNGQSRKEVTCPYCGYSCCRSCWRRYLLETVKDAHCMNCKKGLSREILQQALTKTWVGKQLKEHRENILMDREKAMLPATQPYIERQKKIDDINKDIVGRRSEITDLESKIHQKRVEIYGLERKCFRLKNRVIDQDDSDDEDKEEKKLERRRFIHPCPKEECRGFLSSAYKCAVCSTWVCPQCNAIKAEKNDTNHICNPDDVKTMELIREQSKPCPGCGERIQKVSGCFASDTSVLKWNNEVVSAKNIVVGDILVGDNGNPTEVLELVSGEDDMYEISQNKADNYVVNQFHELSLKIIGNKKIYYQKAINGWEVTWFDHKEKVKRTRRFANIEDARQFVYGLDSPDIIDIPVFEYLKLPRSTKNILVGYRSEILTLTSQKKYIDNLKTSSIKISPLGKGTYYGWKVSGETERFLLSDHTTVHNCSQMWCPFCKQAYDWNTMQIVHGRIHNPHYYEWQRRMNNGEEIEREPGDIPCGGLPYVTQIKNKIMKLLDLKLIPGGRDHWGYQRQPTLPNNEILHRMLNLHRIIEHIQNVELRRYQVTEDLEEQNLQLRIDYVMNKIDEDPWKKELQRREKKRDKDLAIFQVLDMYSQTMSDMFRHLISLDKEEDLLQIDEEMKELTQYANNQFDILRKRYNNMMPMIKDYSSFKSVGY